MPQKDIRDNNTKNDKFRDKGGVGWLLLVLFIVVTLANNSCGSEKKVETQSAKPKQVAQQQNPAKIPEQKPASTTEPKIEKEKVPPLKEYVIIFKNLAKEVEAEHAEVVIIEGVTNTIRQKHWELNEKIMMHHVTSAKHPNHMELSGKIIRAHHHNASLWQEYQDQQSEKAEKTKALIAKQLSEFYDMARKIESGEMKDM